MNGPAPARGLKGYLAALVATIVFPLVWMRSVRLARRHTDRDPRAVAKVGAGIVVGVLLFVGGFLVVYGFQATATEGMYGSMEKRLASAVGESAYQDAVTTVDSANNAIPIIQGNLANATDPAKKAELQDALNKTIEGRDKAQATLHQLAPNHELYLRLEPLVDAQDDAAIHDAVQGANLATPSGTVAGTDAAIALKDKAVKDMQVSLFLFVWPSLVGAFFAPLAFALGSILRNAYTESDTVGFKPYPGGAAGLFLLFGAFGVPSIPFAAWVFMDAENRSREGQIAL